jgi:hypothetical protein
MSPDTEMGSERLMQSRWRLRVAALAAGLLMAGLASASSASGAVVVTHSAKSGEFRGGRLTLHGVRERVTYMISGGRTGTESVRRAHRRVFMPGKPATGTLHVAGHRGADEPTFRLSRPRYNAALHTVSYRAVPLDNKGLPGRSARAAGMSGRQFGAASLTIVPHPTVASGDNGGNDCQITLHNSAMTGVISGRHRFWDLQQVSATKWDTDSWASSPPGELAAERDGTWESDGGLWRGCHNTVVWQFKPQADDPTPPGTITVDLEWDWGQLPRGSCTSSNPEFTCQYRGISGAQVYVLYQTPS